MFSPVGKKKLLLQMKMGGVDADDMAAELARTSPNKRDSPNKSSHDLHDGGEQADADEEDAATVGTKKKRVLVPLTGPTDSVASTASLLSAIAAPGVDGIVMTRVLEATVRYKPDTVSLYS